MSIALAKCFLLSFFGANAMMIHISQPMSEVHIQASSRKSVLYLPNDFPQVARLALAVVVGVAEAVYSEPEFLP